MLICYNQCSHALIIEINNLFRRICPSVPAGAFFIALAFYPIWNGLSRVCNKTNSLLATATTISPTLPTKTTTLTTNHNNSNNSNNTAHNNHTGHTSHYCGHMCASSPQKWNLYGRLAYTFSIKSKEAKCGEGTPIINQRCRRYYWQKQWNHKALD